MTMDEAAFVEHVAEAFGFPPVPVTYAELAYIEARSRELAEQRAVYELERERRDSRWWKRWAWALPW
jgi:hypothetical protein